jgi:catechol 2,3-dioxygenase-like lactoylglutathione lyase family enzyme
MHIDHVNIVVRDIERSVAFYRDVLGFAITNRKDLSGDWIESIVGLKDVRATVVFVMPPGGGVRIELLQYHAPAGAEFPDHGVANAIGLRHFAFKVDDIDAVYERLLAAGVEFVGPPVTVPQGIVKTPDKRLCYFHDPDGVLLEITEYEV